MKATELRVNSWYNSTKFQIPVICEFADFAELSARADGAKVDEDLIDEMFEPIPITKKVLLKSGFKLSDICKDFEYLEMPYYANNAVLLFFNSNRTKRELSDYYIGYGSTRGGKYHVVTLRWIKYIHQLQSLYFDLTNKELTIKL